ncbi:efflux RND transporter permease subunit [Aminipila sp.]|uniref:efflux RND transporter permease subunit n=1 Tax=Aminipila sp. TaxID=2060095 RepID=UPI0028976766|nr:efflux RND transporter permease subunit [Aminipila sp.]
MKKFNLTEWALKHKQFMYFIVGVIAIAGIFSYQSLGRMEYPDFTIRQMIVSVGWPGATAKQVGEQVTDKIEKKLQDTPGLDYLESCSKPGQSVIYVYLEDTVEDAKIRATWFEVRNMVNDIKDTLPKGVIGPYFNDRFDDVFGNVYAITGDGYSYEQMRVKAEEFRQELLQNVPDVKKVELIGVQDEKIYVEVESSKLSQLKLDPNIIANTLQAQNSMTPTGKISVSSDDLYLRVTGIFDNVEQIKNLPIRANGNTFRLGDIATVKRGYEDPETKMYFNGQEAIGIAVSMDKGGNVLTLGHNLEIAKEKFEKEAPAGLELHQVANQPEVVKDSINEFKETLALAVIIVLVVCFVSLGRRPGIIVAFSIPLVICGVFACMKLSGIALQQISLGALIIALGLLVDDAIITTETMIVKLEQGWERDAAASFAYTATAYPRLTGALITCAAFTPVFFSKGLAAEFVGCIFIVVSMALILSWLVAGTITPMLGEWLIKVKPEHHGSEHNQYDKKIYNKFKQLLGWCLNHRKIVVITTIICFTASCLLFSTLKQEFFPGSARPELIVDLALPEGSNFEATDNMAKKFAKELDGNENIVDYSYYVGQSSPRFVLTISPLLPNTSNAQFIIVTKDKQARTELSEEIKSFGASEFPDIRMNRRILQTGPGDLYPVNLRVSGTDVDQVRQIAQKIASKMEKDPNLCDVNMNWNEKSKVINLKIDQDKARALGVDSQSLSMTLFTELSGYPVTEFREGDKTISIVLRQDLKDSKNLDSVKNLNVITSYGTYIPLDQIAEISYGAEEGLIWKRNIKPTITIQANVATDITGNNATQQTFDDLETYRKGLPAGYSVDIGGSLEMTNKSIKLLVPTIPIMLLIIMVLLMIQLQDLRNMALALSTAPLGIIGASLALFLTDRPTGFVVYLGILALAGIIMRNSVILIDQIEQQIASGETKINAIINATVMRFRPILLTATAAILGMIPLASSVFWGPMAVAIAGGLFVATVLTLLVLPTLYAVFFKVKNDEEGIVLNDEF